MQYCMCDLLEQQIMLAISPFHSSQASSCDTWLTSWSVFDMPAAWLQVRLNLLLPLLKEAYNHLHTCLCASVLGRKLFLQPFNRDVEVTDALLAAMRSSLNYCKQVGMLEAAADGSRDFKMALVPATLHACS
jgi:hypothetical protein